ncbi:hypothetical protein APHAL10511_005464 [Amanita phalloides]|nr:hypothetical protein APHAL10511_005464 [Amanita phalloides]
MPHVGIRVFNIQPWPLCYDNALFNVSLCGSHGLSLWYATRPNNVLSVAGFLNEYANFADLATFLANFRPDLNGNKFTVSLIDGGQNSQAPGTAGLEANLDIQYTVGLVNSAPVNFFSSGLGNINGFINMANAWLRQSPPPTVVSISYGFNENQLSQSSATTLCNIFAQLGARGTSVLIASGDGGVSGSRLNNTCTTFVPTFPASCPFITAVGATTGIPEVGAGLSAGGFSNYFPQPGYQTVAVAGYLSKLGGTYSGRFNRAGRAYPDISAQGDKILIVRNQTAILVAGTSASTPITASVVALINDRLITKANRILGFLNPLIYAHPTVFNDIISGSNPGCSTSGFPATGGWDPVTGYGTPNFPRMAAAIGI